MKQTLETVYQTYMTTPNECKITVLYMLAIETTATIKNMYRHYMEKYTFSLKIYLSQGRQK